MSCPIAQIPNVRKAFQSILRADYISISDMKQLKCLDEYYVDYLKNLPKVLQDQDVYINGRRGSGKTVLLMRAYYECLKTILPGNKSNNLLSEKVLPLYIDLSQCKDIFKSETDVQLEQNFVFKLVYELQHQLEFMYKEKPLSFISKDYSKVDEFDQIQRLLTEGFLLKKEKSDIAVSESAEQKNASNGKLNLTQIEAAAGHIDTSAYNYTAKIQEQYGVSVQNFLSYLGKIRQESNLDAIYVFIDEFSDLTVDEQEKFSILLKKLLGSKNNIFFKVGTITDRFYFGENIIVGRDIFPISLDLNDFVERYKGITMATKVLLNFTKELVEKRLKTYTESNVSTKDLFGANQEEIFCRISREAMGVPRTIGLILQAALSQAEIRTTDTISIQISDINSAIRETRKTYFKQFQGAIQKHVIPGFYMDMWNNLITKALEEKKQYPNRPASHFMIDPVRKKYMNIFCENFMIHCLEDSRASKYGGNYVLFAFDYDICNDINIIYADEKDEFTSARFIYDGILKDFDCFFLKDKIKSYRCPECKKIYDEADVAMMKKKKRCFDCDCELDEIIHCDMPISDGNYTEVEVKILGVIATLSEEEAMSAYQISEAVGCSLQKVSNWCGKVLKRQNLISVISKNKKNYYYDNPDKKIN